MGSRIAVIAPPVAALALTASCVRPTPRATVASPANINVATLWIEPDIAARDLFHGPGGPELAPKVDQPFTFVKEDSGGYSPGYEVRGPDGTEWSVKLGDEAQTEVAASRILWAIGFHQPPNYLLATWTMTGEKSGVQGVGRFRPELPDRQVVGEWSWYENEFVDTAPFRGLIVANLVLNNWDWKTTNNKIYDVNQPDSGSPSRRYVVRDLGASLGKTTFPALFRHTPIRGLGQGTRNDLEGFESQRFIKRVNGDQVTFHYRGIHQPVVEAIRVPDVVWACRLMAQLSDRQWDSAFRAAGYNDEMRQRYIAKLKAKVAEGLALSAS